MKIVAALLAVLTLLSGCGDVQSVLNAAGPSASMLKNLILFIVVVSLVVWLAVIAILILSLVRSRRVAQDETASGKRLQLFVTGAVMMTVFIVAGLTLASFLATRAISFTGEADLTIRVRAQQWWWQFIYEDATPDGGFQTANEMHIPVGRNVRVLLESPDVIHSFWVPSLAGKMDLVPGRENTLVFRADRPGVYRGQCAEFCGLQHSHMAFMVMADDEASYRRWANKQKAVAAMPQDADALAGKAVFLRKQCAACHTVRGTPAAGTTGPDLTHVGSRRTIGAGLLETTRGSLAAWIADPQTLKPGNNMLLVPLTGEELRQVSAYMEGLD
ncbi:cytochrome c oxidase subunit II [Agrobacterium pusense]|uniref:cytochrome c oxidase subunit II n=1 Tax=Agrobacterium pusense TaxID=648995 RepID=UPI0010BED215|nr:cytochrome c oxidase subunit II [Agrobacterium pusense]MDH0116035.1 cytochrome c oxidase subunit II [Agrobacterium pusense]QCL87370.1 cytochrome c oxidase subunit II [Agrobacterium pusense]